jgi:hypothetical protein
VLLATIIGLGLAAMSLMKRVEGRLDEYW